MLPAWFTLYELHEWNQLKKRRRAYERTSDTKVKIIPMAMLLYIGMWMLNQGNMSNCAPRAIM